MEAVTAERRRTPGGRAAQGPQPWHQAPGSDRAFPDAPRTQQSQRRFLLVDQLAALAASGSKQMTVSLKRLVRREGMLSADVPRTSACES